MEDLSRLQPVHPRQEPDGVRPDQPLQRRHRQRGAGVRAGVRGVQSDAAITELRLENIEKSYDVTWFYPRVYWAKIYI